MSWWNMYKEFMGNRPTYPSITGNELPIIGPRMPRPVPEPVWGSHGPLQTYDGGMFAPPSIQWLNEPPPMIRSGPPMMGGMPPPRMMPPPMIGTAAGMRPWMPPMGGGPPMGGPPMMPPPMMGPGLAALMGGAMGGMGGPMFGG